LVFRPRRTNPFEEKGNLHPMAKKLAPVTEQYQHFVEDLKESF